MKRLFLCSTVFLFLFVVSSCTHDWVAPANKVIKGEWQWVYSNGGAGNKTIAPINNTVITLSLNDDSTYVFYLNNETEVSGNYTIQTTDNARVLHLDQGVQISMLAMQPEQHILAWDSSQLQLFDNNISDSFIHRFKSIQ